MYSETPSLFAVRAAVTHFKLAAMSIRNRALSPSKRAQLKFGEHKGFRLRVGQSPAIWKENRSSNVEKNVVTIRNKNRKWCGTSEMLLVSPVKN